MSEYETCRYCGARYMTQTNDDGDTYEPTPLWKLGQGHERTSGGEPSNLLTILSFAVALAGIALLAVVMMRTP